MIFITSTDTGVGKTFFAKVLIQDLIDNKLFKASEIAYFKPIQCGLEMVNKQAITDSDSVIKSNPEIKTFNSYFFEYPAAPNFAASLENKIIDTKKIINDFKQLKKDFKFIIVEGAGGIAVPITNDYLVSDLIKDLNLAIILVIRSELGTINHSLLSIEHARNKQIEILGIKVSAAKAINESIYTKNDPEINKIQKQAAINSILSIGNVELFDLNKLKQSV